MKRHLLMVVALFISVAAMAQDGLYAPVLPDDIAFVRVINATVGEAVTIDVGNTRIGPVSAASGSPYHPVRPGVYVVFAAGTREALTAATQSFHSVLISESGITVIEDSHHEDPLRTQLVLYNLTSSALRLDAVVPIAPLIGSVDPGASGTIAINAIPVTLAALPADAPRDEECGCDIGPAEGPRYRAELVLTRGDSFGVVVTSRDSVLTGFVVKAGVSRGDE